MAEMTNQQQTIWNRTEMHSGIRGATELLQQEVGQAGRITLPAAVTLTPPGRRLREDAERIPHAVMARLGIGLAELEDLRDRLTTVIEAARRDG